MPIIYSRRISRKDLRDNPDMRFVFGDNIQRRGFGGQAKEMRGEPNAIGIATKRKPSNDPDSFFWDDDEWQSVVDRDLYQVVMALDQERTIAAPYDGIGTGLARLPEKAPKIYKSIWDFFNEESHGKCPWPTPLPAKDGRG